jgi:hypothetical protein
LNNWFIACRECYFQNEQQQAAEIHPTQKEQIHPLSTNVQEDLSIIHFSIHTEEEEVSHHFGFVCGHNSDSEDGSTIPRSMCDGQES